MSKKVSPDGNADRKMSADDFEYFRRLGVQTRISEERKSRRRMNRQDRTGRAVSERFERELLEDMGLEGYGGDGQEILEQEIDEEDDQDKACLICSL